MSRSKKSLIEQFRAYFNKYRDAHIALITDDPDTGIIIIYENGSEVVVDVLSWVALFDKLNVLHPKI